MQVVINIYEDTYKDIIENGFIYDEDNEEVAHAIKNGTPLPKGHGRLIDADEYLRKICTYKDTGCGSCNFQCECIADAPTIIEADKESD